jgi:putative Mg2+ transporter-C (MgtC) family protein
MQALHNINLTSLLDTLISLGAAFLLGAAIGYERQYRQRTAGLRTNVLVAVGAAIFVDMADRLDGHSGAVRVVSYVVSGIGFLGAGVIMREQGNVRGLNTAATLWGSAAVGCCAGADLLLEATLGAMFVLMANTLLRPLVIRMSRQPLDVVAVEAINTVFVIVNQAAQKEALTLLEQGLKTANYPARTIQIHPFGATDIQIEAKLAATSIEGKELDILVKQLTANELINQAYWSRSMND